MKLLGIDPGGTTGIAVATYNKRKRHASLTWYDQLVGSAELLVDPTRAAELFDKLNKESLDAVVIENFIGGGTRTRHSDYTMKLVGFFAGLCVGLGVPWVLQVPQKRLSYLADARELLPQKDKHAQDALAHVFAYINTSEIKNAKRKQKSSS